jgi:hypothetical protein
MESKTALAPKWMDGLTKRDKLHILTICCHHTEGIEVFQDMRRLQRALTSVLAGKVEACLRCRNVAIKLGLEEGRLIPDDVLDNFDYKFLVSDQKEKEKEERKKISGEKIREERKKPQGVSPEVLAQLNSLVKKGENHVG